MLRPTTTARRVATVLLAAACAAPLAAQTSDAPARAGRIIDAPGSIRAFAPDESLRSIDPTNVDLRGYFEDLGPDAILWYRHVITLSDPFFEGRSAGTRGFEIATEYIEFYLRKYGLEPAFPSDEGGSRWVSYVQPFTYRGSARRTFELSDAHLSFDGRTLAHERDYAVLANSGGGAVEAPLTFVGYAIESEERGYSSFGDDTDLSGRIAVILRYEPLDDDGNSRWDDNRFSPKARLAPKFAAAADRGAVGVILINPPGAVHGSDDLATIDSSAGFGRPRDFPVIQVNAEVANDLLRAADPEGRGLLEWRRLADRGAVSSVHLDDRATVSMSGAVEVTTNRQDAPSANVGGVLRGSGAIADEWIVVGGHNDHVGYGRGGASGGGSVHPGADDNASGTAGVLVLAKWLTAYYAASEGEDLRSILFLTFGAEEAGLRGSAHYLDNPTIDPEEIVFMLNMDMIGRLRSNTLMIGGTGTAAEFEEILPPLVEASGLTAAFSPTGSGPSDHANFSGDDIPVLFMFTGLHPEYHQPSDEGFTVNPAGAVTVMEFSEAIVREIAARPDRLTYQETGRRARRGGRDRDVASAPPAAEQGREAAATEPRSETQQSSAAPSSRTAARVQFGIVPDYTAEIDRGILVGDITAGTAADDAGLRGGDVLLAWDDEELTGLRRFMELLMEREPGDVVNITIKRGRDTSVVPVTLKARSDG